MMHRIIIQGLSNRQPYPQGHIFSKQTGLPASSYAHDRESFIVGVTSHLKDHSAVRDANQKSQMMMTDRDDRQEINTSVSKYKNTNQSSSSNIANVKFNSSVGLGGDQLDPSFESETPAQQSLVQQNLF